MKKPDCLCNTILARTLMICLNLARTNRVLPFLLWNWHRLQSCMKCPMFCTNWHDVRVCAFGCPDFWHEVSNVLHELARCSSLCIWLADHLARSVQYFARIGTMFEFVPLVGTMFGTKCPTFGTKLHEVARRMHEEGSMLFC